LKVLINHKMIKLTLLIIAILAALVAAKKDVDEVDVAFTEYTVRHGKNYKDT